MKEVLRLFEEGLKRLKHHFTAGLITIIFIALFIYLAGIVVDRVIDFLVWLELGIIYSTAFLLGVILAIGLIVNVLGSQKFATSNSFLMVMARSFIGLAEKTNNPKKLKAHKVSLSSMSGIDSLAELMVAQGKFEARKLELMIESPNGWPRELSNSSEFQGYQTLIKKTKKEGVESAKIYILSAERDGEIVVVDGLCSTTPTILTGLPFFGVPIRKATKENVKKAVAEITSGTLGNK